VENPARNPGRFAGALYVITSIVGFFAMGYVPDKLIVNGNAAATTANIVASETLFRTGIAGELIGQAGFIFVAIALYDLFKGVDRRRAMLMVVLIVISVPIAYLNELNSVAALMLARGATFLSVVDKPQRDAMAMMFLNLHDRGIGIAQLFWGLWLFPLGYLVYRSRFLPRMLGVWLVLAGIAWVALFCASVMAPQYQGRLYSTLQPALVGEIVFMFWLLIRGARPPVTGVESDNGFIH
jgi:hypothetical protein